MKIDKRVIKKIMRTYYEVSAELYKDGNTLDDFSDDEIAEMILEEINTKR